MARGENGNTGCGPCDRHFIPYYRTKRDWPIKIHTNEYLLFGERSVKTVKNTQKSHLKFVFRAHRRNVVYASVNAVQDVEHASLKKLLRRFLHPTPRQNCQKVGKKQTNINQLNVR